MRRTFIITLACLLLGFPVTVGSVAALGMAAALPSAQGLYLSLLLGPVLWTALYAFVFWHDAGARRRKAEENSR